MMNKTELKPLTRSEIEVEIAKVETAINGHGATYHTVDPYTYLAALKMAQEKAGTIKFFSEETRKKMSESAKKRCTPEWRNNISEKYSTKLDKKTVIDLYDSGLTQKEVAEQLNTTQKVICKFMKRNGIIARIAKKRDQYGVRNSLWKGDNATYKALHLRVSVHRGKAEDYGCSVCGSKGDNKWYDWANLTGSYNDVCDYAPMCRKCHRGYDRSRVVMLNAK